MLRRACLLVIDQLTGRLGMVAELDAGIGPIKQRARGLTGGQLLLGWPPRSWPGRTAGLDPVRAAAGRSPPSAQRAATPNRVGTAQRDRAPWQH